MCRIAFYFISLLFISVTYNVNSANILGLFPHTGKSHFMVFEPLLRRLAERGHNVTVASFFPLKTPPRNYEDISFQGIAELRVESFDLSIYETSDFLYRIPRLGSIAKQLIEFQPLATSALNVCERIINYRAFTDILNQEYDVVILENFNSDCMLGLLHVYGIKAPVISLLSGTPMPWTTERLGAGENPAYVPIITSSFTTYMSFMDRLENTLLSVMLKQWYNQEIQLKEKTIIERNFGKIPDLRDLARNVSLVMLNSFHVLTGVKPLLPGLIEVGGIHLDHTTKPIPQFIEKFLNESDNGVILFSFGSQIRTSSLPSYKERIFINALSKLKQNVIWKYEDSGEEGTRMGNILKVKWIPQYELLKHKKVIAFICHGGMLGMTESVSAGKPMLVVPFFGDQPSNAAAAAQAGIARVVSYMDLTEEHLTDALHYVLSDKVRDTTNRVSKAWSDRETAPLDTAVFYTERLIRWGTSIPLYATARDLPFYQLALIDVIATILIICAILATVVFYLISKIIGLFKKGKEKMQ